MPKIRHNCKYWWLLGFLALSLSACDPFLYGGRLGRGTASTAGSTSNDSGSGPESTTKPNAAMNPAPISPAAEKLADLSSRIDKLQTRVQRLEGQVEENRYHLRQLQEAQAQKSDKQPESPAELDEVDKESQAEEPAASEGPAEGQESQAAVPAPTPPTPETSSTPAAPLETVPPPGEASPSQAPAASPAEVKLFKEGMELYRKKSYSPARQKFQQYLSEHPDGPKAVEARYYLADTFYQERKLSEAIVEFNKVVNQYPQSVLAPPALLKQAFAFQAQGKTKVYNLILEKIVADYPQSRAAQQARNLMASGTTQADTPAESEKGN